MSGGVSGCRALELAGVTSGRIIVSTKWGGNAWEHREYTIDPTWTADASFVPARCEAEAAASTLMPASQRLQHSILQFRPRRVPAGLMIVKTDASGVKSRDREIVRHGMKIQGRVRFHWVSASTSLAVTPLWPDGSAGPTWKGKAGVAKGPWSEDPADYITGIWSGEASPVKCSGRSIAAKER